MNSQGVYIINSTPWVPLSSLSAWVPCFSSLYQTSSFQHQSMTGSHVTFMIRLIFFTSRQILAALPPQSKVQAWRCSPEEKGLTTAQRSYSRLGLFDPSVDWWVHVFGLTIAHWGLPPPLASGATASTLAVVMVISKVGFLKPNPSRHLLSKEGILQQRFCCLHTAFQVLVHGQVNPVNLASPPFQIPSLIVAAFNKRGLPPPTGLTLALNLLDTGLGLTIAHWVLPPPLSYQDNSLNLWKWWW